MNQSEYLRLIDTGVESDEISKVMQAKEPSRTVPVNWRETEHLRTDFTQEPAMPVRVEADVVDQPSTQRMYGAPAYDQNGDLRCRCCGGVLGRSMSGSGEGIAVCTDPGCLANGFAYAEGSYTRNPHRVMLR
jgi:hypothetical protein